MKAKLVEFLSCPGCKEPLQCKVLQEDRSLPWAEIVEGILICTECHQDYPIRKGVPRLMIGEQSTEVKKTVDGFCWEWLTFNEPIKDTYMSSKTNFLDFIYPVREDFFENKFVLDAGCGMGRFLRLGAEFGSREIIGVDLSSSVDAAYENTRDLPNAHVVQADIFALPFKIKFDYIFSVGVLHHLPQPRAGFSQLIKRLKKNGSISVWVYARENNDWVVNFLNPLRKHITSRLPRPLLYAISHCLGVILYGTLKLIYKPVNEKLKLGHVLPYNDYLYYNSRLDYLSLVSVIFDHLVPQLSHYIPRNDFERWFREEDLCSVKITSRNNMSWRGLGTRVSLFENNIISKEKTI